MAARFVSEATLAATERLAELAAACGVSLPTLAVAWTLTRDFLGAALVGATSPVPSAAVSFTTGAAGAGLLAAAFDISRVTQLRTAGVALARQVSISPPRP